MRKPTRKYKSFDEVKPGDMVYLAWFVSNGGRREPFAPTLVVHGTDFITGTVTVRDARHPEEPWYANGEWMPSWYALYTTREDAIAALENAASHGEV